MGDEGEYKEHFIIYIMGCERNLTGQGHVKHATRALRCLSAEPAQRQPETGSLNYDCAPTLSTAWVLSERTVPFPEFQRNSYMMHYYTHTHNTR